jgi:hypothetical protein
MCEWIGNCESTWISQHDIDLLRESKGFTFLFQRSLRDVK